MMDEVEKLKEANVTNRDISDELKQAVESGRIVIDWDRYTYTGDSVLSLDGEMRGMGFIRSDTENRP